MYKCEEDILLPFHPKDGVEHSFETPVTIYLSTYCHTVDSISDVLYEDAASSMFEIPGIHPLLSSDPSLTSRGDYHCDCC
jgi:hypothetical protein